MTDHRLGKPSWVDKSALAVAVLALLLTVCELRRSRLHDMMSVRPHVTLSLKWNRGDAAQVVLSNNGLGPATIRTLEVLVDGKHQSNWVDVTRALHLPGPGVYAGGVDVLRAGDDSRLYEIAPGPAADALVENWQRVEINWCYCSFYDECWAASTRKPGDRSPGRCPSPTVPFNPRYPVDQR